MAESISMATSGLFIIKSFFVNLDMTDISKSGCKWLSKANWKELT